MSLSDFSAPPQSTVAHLNAKEKKLKQQMDKLEEARLKKEAKVEERENAKQKIVDDKIEAKRKAKQAAEELKKAKQDAKLAVIEKEKQEKLRKIQAKADAEQAKKDAKLRVEKEKKAKKEKQAAEKKVKKDAEARSHEEQAKVAKAEKIVKDEERAKKREEERQYTVSGWDSFKYGAKLYSTIAARKIQIRYLQYKINSKKKLMGEKVFDSWNNSKEVERTFRECQRQVDELASEKRLKEKDYGDLWQNGESKDSGIQKPVPPAHKNSASS